jgi:hypothetical protein
MTTAQIRLSQLTGRHFNVPILGCAVLTAWGPAHTCARAKVPHIYTWIRVLSEFPGLRETVKTPKNCSHIRLSVDLVCGLLDDVKRQCRFAKIASRAILVVLKSRCWPIFLVSKSRCWPRILVLKSRCWPHILPSLSGEYVLAEHPRFEE